MTTTPDELTIHTLMAALNAPESPREGAFTILYEDVKHDLRIVYVNSVWTPHIRRQGYEVQRKKRLSGHYNRSVGFRWIAASGCYAHAGTVLQHYHAAVAATRPQCERCGKRVETLAILSADGVDQRACQRCIDAYDRMQQIKREWIQRTGLSW